MVVVSVVIPTHNRSAFLSRAIRSVLNQSFQDFEIVVVDDASTDNTRDVVCKFQNPRIRYLRLEQNLGEAEARNAGIAATQSKYIAFLDDDDEWLPQKLSVQIDFMGKSPAEVGFVYAGFTSVYLNKGNAQRINIPTKRGFIYSDILHRNFIGTPSTVLVRRSCLDAVGLFDKNIAFGVDHDLWLRISKDFRIEFISEPLVIRNIHDERLSNDPDVVIQGHRDMLEKYPLNMTEHRRYHSRKFLTVGALYCYQGHIKKARESFLTSIKLYPYSIRGYLNFGLSLLGSRNYIRLRNIKQKVLKIFRSGKANGPSQDE